jgi:hypothetical protein
MPDTVVLLLSVVPLAMVLMMIVSQRVGEVSDAYTGEITGRGGAQFDRHLRPDGPLRDAHPHRPGAGTHH